MPPEKPPNENVPHATHPADERPRSLSLINPNDATHWLALADTALHQGASEENIAEKHSPRRGLAVRPSPKWLRSWGAIRQAAVMSL